VKKIILLSKRGRLFVALCLTIVGLVPGDAADGNVLDHVLAMHFRISCPIAMAIGTGTALPT
jgi:hypothetical protein